MSGVALAGGVVRLADHPRRSASHFDQMKQFLLDMPRGLSRGAEVVLIALRVHARDDGSGIFVGLKALCAMTRTDRRTLLRHMAELRERGLLVDDGWKGHGGGLQTRQRRLVLPARESASTTPDDRQQVVDNCAGKSGNGWSDQPLVSGATHHGRGGPMNHREVVVECTTQTTQSLTSQYNHPDSAHARGAPLVNKFPGRCARCGQIVMVGEGLFVATGGGKGAVAHLQCPADRPPPKLDLRYFGRPTDQVAVLPRPPGSREYNAWCRAREGFMTPIPTE